MSDRFEFGKNWGSFLNTMDSERLDEAVRSLSEWLGVSDLTGKTFFDIGSGSGLFSLAARKMGATVSSFDYDNNCVKCTKELKRRYFPDDPRWTIERGDILDESYMSKYGEYDVVYSWGVLHHTGHMYKALENAGKHVKSGGSLFIAIYNDQGPLSKAWTLEKKIYVSLPKPFKMLFAAVFFIVLWTVRAIEDIVQLKPFYRWKQYKKKRGMSPWHDAVDWVGGYPFEVAKPEDIFSFFHKRDFTLEKLYTCGMGNGCNQYLLKKN